MRITRNAILILCVTGITACNMNNESKNSNGPATSTDTKPAVKIDSATQGLLKHFKENGNFPVVIDSAYMSKIKKGDSLGAREVHMLTKKWFNDSMTMGHEYVLADFYTIDSAKEKHAFVKWAEKIDIGQTKYANAYALQKITLADNSILLIWALATMSYEADPYMDRTTVYFTFFDGTNLGQTFTLGELMYAGDPPSIAHTFTTGTLAKDGKLQMKWLNLVEDVDSMRGELSTAVYEYQFAAGNIKAGKKTYNPMQIVKVAEGN